MVDPGTGRPLGATAAALLALGGGRGGGRERIAVAGGGYDRMMAGGGPRTAAAAYATAYEAAVLGLAGARGAGGAGAGGWSVEEFVVEGWVDVVSGEWQLERRCVSVPFALKYKVGWDEGTGGAPRGTGRPAQTDACILLVPLPLHRAPIGSDGAPCGRYGSAVHQACPARPPSPFPCHMTHHFVAILFLFLPRPAGLQRRARLLGHVHRAAGGGAGGGAGRSGAAPRVRHRGRRPEQQRWRGGCVGVVRGRTPDLQV